MFLYIAILLSFSMSYIMKCGYWIHIILGVVVFMFMFPNMWKLQAPTCTKLYTLCCGTLDFWFKVYQVGESIVELAAIGKQSTVFFILYIHKMYSLSLGIKLQEEVTYCVSYISEKSIHRLFTQFMVLILPIPTRHTTNYDRQHLRHMNTYICMT